MAIKTKFFASGPSAAPVLSGTAGAMIALLDAILVNGYGGQTATSVVVASNIATVTLPVAHSFLVDTIIVVAGATPAGLNGEKRVLSVPTATTVTFAAPTIADGAATGTITAGVAAAGWTKDWSGTNLAAYKSAAVDSTYCVLRVDDTGTTTCRVVGYEFMSAISTGVGPFPTTAQQNGGLYWPKSTAASAAARLWFAFADDRGFYLYTVPATADGSFAGSMFGFGDLIPKKTGDAYACAIFGSTGATPQTVGSAGCLSYGQIAAVATAEVSVPRAYTAVGSAQVCGKTAALNVIAGYSGSNSYGAQGLNYPNGPDNGLLTAQVQIIAGAGIRGAAPGVYHSPQNLGNSFATGDKVDGAGSLAARKLMALRAGNVAVAVTTAGVGTVFVDMYGDWR
jgi:hypothetical protein